MSSDVVPMHEMFLACREVLDTVLKPIHYTELTRRGLAKLGKSPGDVNFKRQIEDVREKMLQAGWQGVFYLGRPYCLGGVAHWFQRGFNLEEPVVIHTDISAAIQATFEALMRDMLKKNPNASNDTRMMGKARGLQIEQAVKEWFKGNWPTLYRPADNDGLYNKPCDHDFKLEIDHHKFIKVDVAGPDRNGNHGNGSGKRVTDLHLICDLTGDGRAIEWKGVVRGKNFIPNLVPELQISPLQMIVWLNCIQDGLPYDLLQGKR